MTPSILYICKELNFSYPLGSVRVPALNNLNLSVQHGDLTCLAGPSGSGKSTLLNVLGLIEPVQSGEVLYRGTPLSYLAEKQKNQLRREELGFVFQHFFLFDTLTAFENVEYFLKHVSLDRAKRKLMVDEALYSVGLSEHSRKRPLEMSGGQRQRVAIARALVKKPQVILADEPTASLDQQTGRQIMDIFSRLVHEQGRTVIMASHDPMAISYATTLVGLEDGKIREIVKDRVPVNSTTSSESGEEK